MRVKITGYIAVDSTSGLLLDIANKRMFLSGGVNALPNTYEQVNADTYTSFMR